ncbi:hypothetical protein CLV85_0347 [Salinibacterium amurskyense]|uniref:Uncharacterized protein n=1 Tax=Salinibacterium amurskyense TaxID=205941 RepID=A0A2M9D649_9MICO|nr:hypothetical protein [Salinibacterium amurskyense]PJJ81176.1 hypothetical protein CLV85_0347 [Salinibacterium amurskyense]RLQ83198.1 hypothetical protein D9C83_01725 [Salinibacterium amurskyense]GHD81412.1 hypothetical protein GCM10007394_14610 [Salinibacterium amurskyense]
MSKFTVLLYRLGATAANIAQSVVQANGGGNGDPQVFDETSKRKRKRDAAGDSNPEASSEANPS